MSLIWIIDDESAICSSLGRAFQRLGHQIQTFSSVEPALKLAKTKGTSQPDVIILDVRLPGMDGLTGAAAFQTALQEIPIILMTAFGDLSTAVRAIEGRVFDYLTKPFDLNAMQTAVQRALASRTNVLQTSLHPLNKSKTRPNPLIGSSPAMQVVFKRIALAAAARDCPILIGGESGTGKELVTRAIHEYGASSKEPFLTFSPISFDAPQIDSELYGDEQMVNAGREQGKIGILELAGDGTVHIDEIGDLPLGQQVKLLHVLEQKEFVRAGSNKPRPLNARILATTSRDLRAMIQQGAFREDLYLRLSVFVIELPPLRERTEDIPSLANYFLAKHGYPSEGDNLDITATTALMRHSWSGNVRELSNAMEHAAILARGQRIYPEHLPELRAQLLDTNSGDLHAAGVKDISGQLDKLIRLWLREHNAINGATIEDMLVASPSNPNPEDVGTIYDSFLGVVEPALIRALLETAQGNRAAVANALGLHRSTLRQKMRRHKIDEP